MDNPGDTRKAGNGTALSEQARTMTEDYGMSTGGSITQGVSFQESLKGSYPSADTNSETSGPGQMKPGHSTESAGRGCRFG